MECFSRLPEQITLDFLTRLPSESMLECKLVCTNWSNLVSRHPSFSKMHLIYHLNQTEDSGKLSFIAWTDDIETHTQSFQYFDYNENHESATPIEKIRRIIVDPLFRRSVFVGSYNGLACLSQSKSKDFIEVKTYICNPITKEFVVLPEIKTDCNWLQYWTSGFGYVSTTNEYKVIRIYLLKNQSFDVYVYTLGSGCGWKNIVNIDFRRLYSPQQGIFANGALYWLYFELSVIITFNVAEEIFCECLSFPPSPPDGYWDYVRIGVLDGFLFLPVYVEGVYHDICLLKKKNDNHDLKAWEEDQSMVWSKEFKVPDGELSAVTKSDSVLTYAGNCLNFYDPKASTSNRFVEFKERFYQVAPHMNTLVSLKELGGRRNEDNGFN